MINDRIDKAEALFKSQFIEINEFLHTIHKQFETFVATHKKEHIGLNVRLLRASEDVLKVSSHFAHQKT